MTISLDSISVPESETAHRIVEAAAQIIAEEGEAHLQINDVCEIAGFTSTTLYSFFDDREHLVCSALLHLFSTTTYSAINQFQALVMESTTKAGFRRMISGVATVILTPERRRVRRIRLHALAAVRHRPALRSSIGDLLRREIDQLASWIEQANDAAWVSVRDPQSTAAWVLAHTVAHTALDGDGSIDAQWDQVWRWGLHQALFDDDRPFPIQHHEDRPKPTHPDRHPTALRIIDWAADRIDMVGESAFRAEHLPPEIAKSTTPIYRYFGTRENLVGAAQEERFARSVMRIVDVNDTVSLDALISVAFSPDRQEARAQRLEAMASTLGRPEVAQAIAERRDANLATIAEALSDGRADVDLYDGVRLGAAFLTGLAVVELLELGIDADTHRAISLPILHRAFADTTR